MIYTVKVLSESGILAAFTDEEQADRWKNCWNEVNSEIHHETAYLDILYIDSRIHDTVRKAWICRMSVFQKTVQCEECLELVPGTNATHRTVTDNESMVTVVSYLSPEHARQEALKERTRIIEDKRKQIWLEDARRISGIIEAFHPNTTGKTEYDDYGIKVLQYRGDDLKGFLSSEMGRNDLKDEMIKAIKRHLEA